MGENSYQVNVVKFEAFVKFAENVGLWANKKALK